jgi:steroid 5-alpha reductase family enzyme
MKWQGLQHTHKTINDYLRLTGGRFSANFTHQYLPLFYSGSADTVMQNIVIAILSNLVQHIASLSLVKAISISVPIVKIVLSGSKLKSGIKLYSGKKIAGQLKLSLCLVQIWTEQVVLRLAKGSRGSSGKYRYRQSLNGYNTGHSPHAASA